MFHGQEQLEEHIELKCLTFIIKKKKCVLPSGQLPSQGCVGGGGVWLSPGSFLQT